MNQRISRLSTPGSKWKQLVHEGQRQMVGQAPKAAQPLLTLIHLSDLHICDAQSPTRMEFVDRYADPDNPLQPIVHYIGTYRAQEFLTVQVLEAMVESVNKIEKGEVEVSKSTVDVEKYIQDITYLFRPYRDGRTLELEIAPEASDWYFDDKLLKYAVTNILTNAFKYSRNKKSPELKVFVEEGSLKIRVKDYGIGIPKSDIRDIFKTFYRASNVGTIQGTGIGLMIVEYAVKKHNGRVEIDSETGRGTVVTLTIP